MKILPWGIAGVIIVAGLLMDRASSGGGQAPKVRVPAVAGSFYPSDQAELGRTIDNFVAQATEPQLENVVAVVAPHAGYIYSGPVAGYTYAQLKGHKFDRVVVIAPSHYEAFNFSSVYDGGAYQTPLGQMPVDQVFAAKLVKMAPQIKLSALGHTPSADHPEHSIEVQLPFLQRMVGQVPIVPIVMGDQTYDACRALGMALAKLAQGTNTLIVASSDLSHYHRYDEAVTLDHKVLHAIEEYDFYNLSRNLELRGWEACGGGPIVATMIAAERLGATQAKVLHYANSGDATGDKSRVVGYGAVALVKAPTGAKKEEEAFTLANADKAALLTIARKSVETAVREGKPYEGSAGGRDALAQDRGAFVTLTKHGELRGCIGYVAPIEPLYLTVRDVARAAALRDNRFRPVTVSELGDLEYEISVLSPMRRVRDVQEIRVGEHGLLIHKGGREGLLLPQVPVEQKWDRATFLEQVCYKAGLPAGAWKDPETDLFRFTALVFGGHTAGAGLVMPGLLRERPAELPPPAPGLSGWKAGQ